VEPEHAGLLPMNNAKQVLFNMKTLLDTNFLLDIVKFRISLDELNFFTLSSCIDELNTIANSRKKDAVHARIALKMMQKKNIKAIKVKEKGDNAILKYARANNCSVATNDRNLIKHLKKLNIQIIRIRQKKFLMNGN
jgi:rRNA-processing protein FCF1